MEMETVRVHVRGQMGVQILQLAVALSSLTDNEEPIVCVNTGKLPLYAPNKLDDVFDYTCRVIEIDSTRKTQYCVADAATKIMRNREMVFRWFKPKKFTQKSNLPPAIHIRSDGKNISSVESYRHLIDIAKNNQAIGRPIIYTNDTVLTNDIINDHDLDISNQTEIQDWIDIFYSPFVYAAPSEFIISMLIFNPDKHVTFLGDKYCDGSYASIANDLLFLKELVNFCPNVKFIND